jgi:hypothetical protein
MHQNSASRERFEVTGEISLIGNDPLRNADPFGMFSLIRKLGCVVKHEQMVVRGSRTIPSRLKMTGKYVRFIDTVVGEKSIGGLGVCPILADKRNALSHHPSDLLQQLTKPSAKPLVPKLASCELSINPGFCIGSGSATKPGGTAARN